MAGSIDPNRPNPFAFNIGDVSVGDDPDDVKGEKGGGAKKASEAGAAAATTPPPDSIVTTPPPPQLNLDNGARPGDSDDPIRTDAIKGSSRPDPTTATALLEDVKAAYQNVETNVEMMFAKLMQESSGNKDAIKDQTAAIDREIAACKKEVAKLDVMMAKIDELMPKFQAFMNEEAQANQQCVKPDMSQKENEFAAMLSDELKKAGIDLDPSKIQELVHGLSSANGASEMLAMFLITSIAEGDGIKASKDPSLSNPDTPVDPNAALSTTGAQTPGTPPPAGKTETAPGATATGDPPSVDPAASPDLPPDAQAAGFDPTTFEARLSQIADMAETMSQKQNDWTFAFFGPSGDSLQSQNDLILAMMPGLTVDSATPVNPAIASAQTSGVTTQGFEISPETFSMAAMLYSLPAGQGPAAATSFLTHSLDAQITAKIERLTAEITALQAEKKQILKDGPALDAEMAKLNNDLKAGIEKLHKQRDAAVTQVTDMLGDGQGRVDQVKALFVGALVGALDAIANELGSMGGTSAPSAIYGRTSPR